MGNLEQDAIRRILAGDRDAFRVLMDRHLPTVLRMTYRVTGNAVDAEEAAQEAFLLAYKKLSAFREQSAFGTWVYRIAMNCSLNLVERRSRNVAWGAVTIEPGSPSENIAVSRGLTPEAALLQNEALRRRERAMLTLTPMERTAFILRHMEDQPIQVIADALGVQHNSAKQAIFRAVAGVSAELALTRHISLHAGYRALLYKAPTSYYGSSYGVAVPSDPGNLTLSSEPVIGLTYRFHEASE